MNLAQKQWWLGTVAAMLLFVSVSQAQTSPKQSAHTNPQSVTTALASLPEADTIIYASPQRILNDAAPKVISQYRHQLGASLNRLILAVDSAVVFAAI